MAENCLMGANITGPDFIVTPFSDMESSFPYPVSTDIPPAYVPLTVEIVFIFREDATVSSR